MSKEIPMDEVRRQSDENKIASPRPNVREVVGRIQA
jgi:hypothetical protein